MARFAFEVAKHRGSSRSARPAASSSGNLVEFDLQVEDITPILEELKTYPLKVQTRHLRVATNAAAKVTLAEVRRSAPRGNGFLRRSMIVVITQKRGYVKARIGQEKGKTFKRKRIRGSQINRKGYAAPIHFIEGGTEAHRITNAVRVGRRRALAFGKGRKRTFRTTVFHPGTKANPFLERSQRAAVAPASSAFNSKLAQRLNVQKV